MLDRLPEILEVTRPRSQLSWGDLFVRPLGFPKRTHVPNLRSLAHVVLKICSIVRQKFQGSRDLAMPLLGKLICAPAQISKD